MSGDGVLESLLADGIARFELRDFRAARTHFAQAKLRAPRDRRALYWLGAAQYHMGQAGEAQKLLDEALEGAGPALPDRPAAVHEYLARLALARDVDRAVALAEEGIALDARDARVRFIAGNARLRAGDRERALGHYDAAWELEGGRSGVPAFPHLPGQVPFARSSVLVQLERWDDALAAVDDALARDEANPLHHNRRGVILFDGLGQAERALAAVDRAIELDPATVRSDSDGLYHFNRAQYLQALDRVSDALVAVERAISICGLRQYKELRESLIAASRAAAGARPAEHAPTAPRSSPAEPAPRVDYSHVGGMHGLKEQVRRIVEVVHTGRTEAQRYGVERNGILFYGPPGCGKTFFARATAGEFGLDFFAVSLADAHSKFVGEGPEKIAKVFEEARRRAPCLLFFDEFDSIAGRRDEAGSQHAAQHVDSLLQELERVRSVPGLVVAAATNRLDELDPAVIRPGRFDYKVKVYKPDFDARREILQVVLRDRPRAEDCDVTALAQDMEGFSCAQIRSVVDDAALCAMQGSAPISEQLLREALVRQQTAHRYGGKRMAWDDLLLDRATKQRLQFVEKFIEHPRLAQDMGIEAPRGMLLHGPPGTGKTTIARVLASETDASFFAVGAADVFSKWMGESESQVRQLFERARDNVPAIVFLDEVESILARRTADTSGGGRALNSVTNTFLAEMDGIDSSTRVFVIGATNRPELVDEAVLRPGRLSEVLEIGLPGRPERRGMLAAFTAKMKLGADVDLDALADRTEGASGADLKGLCTAAGRNAFLRAVESDAPSPCIAAADFAAAVSELFGDEGEAAKQRIGF